VRFAFEVISGALDSYIRQAFVHGDTVRALQREVKVLSVSKVLSNERGQSRCHLAGEKELFGSLVYMHLLNHYLEPESLV